MIGSCEEEIPDDLQMMRINTMTSFSSTAACQG
jgi:hypothetical protein